MTEKKQTKRRGDRIPVFTFLYPAERILLKKIADRENRSMSGQIRHLLKRELSKQADVPQPAA